MNNTTNSRPDTREEFKYGLLQSRRDAQVEMQAKRARLEDCQTEIEAALDRHDCMLAIELVNDNELLIKLVTKDA